MKKRRKFSDTSNHGSKVFMLFLAQSAILLATVAILFGGLFNYLGNSPPENTNPTTGQTTTYENPTSESILPDITNQNNSNATPNTIHEDISTETLPNTIETAEPTNTESTEVQNNFPVEPVGTIYLTFDDGPSTKITSQILDILKEKNIKATFFILDYSYGSEKEALVIREFEEGHTVALHGISHDYSKIYSSLEALIQNFTALQEKVKNSTGYTSTIIRFPGGSSNTVSKKYCSGIMTEAIEYFSNSEFLYFDWNIDSRDAGGVKTSQEVFENVTSNLKPGKNNIVLMHDSSDKQYTLDALEEIIDFCINEGYEFKAITCETPQVTHNVSN